MFAVIDTIIFSNIVTAFNSKTIGSKVIDPVGFGIALHQAIGSRKHDFAKGTVPGQALIDLPDAEVYVSAGVGKRSINPDDYVLREHRGRVDAYLNREHAAKVESVKVVVYTHAAYLADPDITPDEAERVKGASHVLVAVLASAGPRSPQCARH